MKKVVQSQRKECGQSMVELALTITLLMVILAGTIDLGRAFYTWLGMRDAAQEGASYGSIAPSNSTEISNRITRNLDQLIAPSAYSISVNIIGAPCLNKNNTNNSIRVTIDYPNFPITMPFLGMVLGKQSIAIHATIEDAIISPLCSP